MNNESVSAFETVEEQNEREHCEYKEREEGMESSLEIEKGLYGYTWETTAQAFDKVKAETNLVTLYDWFEEVPLLSNATPLGEYEIARQSIRTEIAKKIAPKTDKFYFFQMCHDFDIISLLDDDSIVNMAKLASTEDEIGMTLGYCEAGSKEADLLYEKLQSF